MSTSLTKFLPRIAAGEVTEFAVDARAACGFKTTPTEIHGIPPDDFSAQFIPADDGEFVEAADNDSDEFDDDFGDDEFDDE